MTRIYPLIALLAVTMLGATSAFAGTEPAQTTTASPKLPNKLAIATDNAKEIMLLMDTNKDGKISKKEWMDFMSKEFDRLDTNHDGFIDVKDLMKTRVTITHVPTEVQGK